MRRILFSPSWILRHALALFMIALFARLGWWQWEKGQSGRGTLQNLFYGVEWPIFAAAVIFGWWQMVREELRPGSAKRAPAAGEAARPGTDGQPWNERHGPGGPGGSGTDGSPSNGFGDDEEDDEELEAYNRYLASLYERDTPSGSGTR
ncbi:MULTISPECIES: hypothetical protein [Protofrankia]|uniref:DNA-binding transcriptional regulator of glucitol operon n=1 Tax=Protofrankia coriariae TaxID=1562887 RepID=A0ABR5F2J1_9ACTN|nr:MULTISPECIES: hypothetical protein [Protofrankia]KLL10863.1 hypothetical protein FrCorBMG51_15080 [Protofrankia coriariae]ONH38156.1 hypothetical protein BL254_01725 [Protofrankia sp. BMG5.30]